MDNEHERLITRVLGNPVTIALALGAAGSVVHAIVNVRKQTLGKYVADAIVGIFNACLILLLCREYGVSVNMTGFLCGVGGYSGAPILDLLSTAGMRFLRSKVGEVKPEERT